MWAADVLADAADNSTSITVALIAGAALVLSALVTLFGQFRSPRVDPLHAQLRDDLNRALADVAASQSDKSALRTLLNDQIREVDRLERMLFERGIDPQTGARLPAVNLTRSPRRPPNAQPT